jgi:nonsense-mediated mRNA decay protein 3
MRPNPPSVEKAAIFFYVMSEIRVFSYSFAVLISKQWIVHVFFVLEDKSSSWLNWQVQISRVKSQQTMPKPKNKGNNTKKFKKTKPRSNSTNNPTLVKTKTTGKRKRDDETVDLDLLQVAEGNNYTEIHNDNQLKRMKKKLKKHKAEEIEDFAARVQIRQRVTHKRTFYYLEQLMLKHGFEKIYPEAIVRQTQHGLDVYFFKAQHATRFNSFLESVLPIEIKRQGRAEDEEKVTYSAEIAQVCKGDVVCLPQRLYNSMGSIGPIVVVYNVNASVYVIDPLTLKAGEISSFHYFNKDKPFRSLFSHQQLIEYTVIDVEDNDYAQKNGKFVLGDVQVCKTSELGQPDSMVFCKTHLWDTLQPGDLVYGYDLKHISDEGLESYKNVTIPDVVLVKKKFDRPQKRFWMLKKFIMEHDDDYEEFLDDLEYDSEMRSKITLYKDPTYAKNEMQVEDEAPKKKRNDDCIRLEELFDNLEF